MRIIKHMFFLCMFFCSCSSEKKTNPLISNTAHSSIIEENDLIKKDSLLTIVDSNNIYQYQIFNSTENGFGYEIFANNKLYIHQATIPAINGNKAFKSKEEAKKIAELVIQKLNNTTDLPTIEIKELDSLKINY